MSIDHSSNMVGYSSTFFRRHKLDRTPPPSRNAEKPTPGTRQTPGKPQERDKLRMQSTQSSDKIVVILWYLICIHHHHHLHHPKSNKYTSNSSQDLQDILVGPFFWVTVKVGRSLVASAQYWSHKSNSEAQKAEYSMRRWSKRSSQTRKQIMFFFGTRAVEAGNMQPSNVTIE